MRLGTLTGAIVNPWKWVAIALAAALVVALGWGGLQTLDASGLRTSLAAEKEARATEAREAAEAALKASEAARAAEARHAVEQGKIVSELSQAKEEAGRVVAALGAERDSLQHAVECYATGGCLGPNSPALAAGDRADRARTLGNLLRQCDRLAEDLAIHAERRNAEVRTLKKQNEADRTACGAANDSP